LSAFAANRDAASRIVTVGATSAQRVADVKFRHFRCLVVQRFDGSQEIRHVDRWGVYELHVTGHGYARAPADPAELPSFKRPGRPRPFTLVRLR
jgi:hypothetical protein